MALSRDEMARRIARELQDGDVVSIYSFDNGVREIAPPTVVGANSRGGLMQSVQYLHAGGGTNMYAGVQVGVNRLANAPPTHSVRRLVFTSTVETIFCGRDMLNATEEGTPYSGGYRLGAQGDQGGGETGAAL